MSTQHAVQIQSIDDVQAAIVDGSGPFLVRSGGSKPALSTSAGASTMDVSGLTGIIEYDPGEYTFTAMAGTPLSTIIAALEQHGQYLPFDPPLAEAGATLGGTVAAGLSGSGRMRYGGVRDFLIGIRFVDGQGRLVRGGGKVVKNAAGFDLPKLFVGSLGRLGILVEVSFKVFPAPKANGTLQVTLPTMADAVALAGQAARAPFDLEALDFAPAGNGTGNTLLWARLGGLPNALPERLQHLAELLGGGKVMDADEEPAFWSQVSRLEAQQDDAAVVKVAVTPVQIPELDKQLAGAGATRHYSVGGNLVWIGWPAPITELDEHLLMLNLPGVVLTGASHQPLIGYQPGGALLARVKQTLDPAGRFPKI